LTAARGFDHIAAVLLPPVDYARPSSVEEAVRLLAEHDGARALAGGQTLLNVMKARASAPDVLVDLIGIAALRGTRRTDDGGLEIGAMATYADMMLSPEIAEARPVLAEVAAVIADVQVRNRGTIGGNVCLSDPTNHFPPLMVALGATMVVRGREGERRIPAEEFFLGVYMTAVGIGELLTSITVPAGGRDGFDAVTIGKEGTCIVSAAACLDAPDGARVVLGCVDSVPVRAPQLEASLNGDLSEGTLREAARGLGSSLQPPSDVHASAEYRRRLAEVCAARAVARAAGRGR
jgi:carbon-monoxide dehydrogenase medium subunit